jgi:dihydrofolate reductase
MFELIVAYDSKMGISKKEQIPWKIREDMQFFKEKTLGNVVIMGKNTFFSLPDRRPLVKRLNIVITHNPDTYKHYSDTYSNLIFTDDDKIHEKLEKQRENLYKTHNLNPDFSIFFIGGNRIYQQYAALCDTLWITKITKDYNCDLFLTMDLDENNYKPEIITKNNEFTITKFQKVSS